MAGIVPLATDRSVACWSHCGCKSSPARAGRSRRRDHGYFVNTGPGAAHSPCFIINPVAGRAGGIAARIAQTMPEAEVLITRCAGQARALAKARRSHAGRWIVAVGGDGTVHEVAGGLVGGSALLAVLAVGTGNDFAQMLTAPRETAAFLDWLPRAGARPCDLGWVRIIQADSAASEHHFINGLGIGFDAAVAASAARLRGLPGFARYLAAALWQLVRYRASRLRLRADDDCIEARQLLVAVGNGRRVGGGFVLTPAAEIDDGQLDLCRADAMPIARLLRILPATVRGTHARFPGVHLQRVRQVVVESSGGLPVHADGEVLAHAALRIEARVLPGALRVASD